MHIMNIAKDRWPQLKQELLPVIYVCIVQTWWYFYFTPFIKIRNFSPVLGILLTILSYFICISPFIFPEGYVSAFTLKHLDHAPAATNLKLMNRTIQLIIAMIALFIFWYNDLYDMPNTLYALLYAHCVIVYILMARAIKRYNNRMK